MNFKKLFTTIDTHVAGEAFRIVMYSSISLQNETMESMVDELGNNFENEKNLLLNEPRGHRGMHGCLIMPSTVADYRLLFFNHSDVNNFKYEGLLTTVTALLETGNIKSNADDVYKIETIDGIFTVKTTIENNEVRAVYLENKSCVLNEQNTNYTSVSVDDRTYFIYSLPDTIPSIQLENLESLSRWGFEMTTEFNKSATYSGIILIEKDSSSTNEVRSITFEKDGYILRSPGIDSTFAIFTSLLEEAEGDVELTNTSIFGSSLTAKAIDESSKKFSIEAEAFITGMNQFVLDEDDPLKDGFLLK